jgi:hypothetical protein
MRRSQVLRRRLPALAAASVLVPVGAVLGFAALDGGSTAPAATEAHAHDGLPELGLASSHDGYAIVLERTTYPAGRARPLRFRILGPDGGAVTGIDNRDTRPMHLVVLRRDLAHYQLLHPRMLADGTLTIPLRLPAGGTYRIVADFTIGGARHVLGVDVQAAGAFTPEPIEPAATSDVVDGYRVAIGADRLRIGRRVAVPVRISRGGREITEFQLDDGEPGHLVAFRQGDMAYVHVHRKKGEYTAALPGPGVYRVFFEFRHRSQDHLAAVTLRAR